MTAGHWVLSLFIIWHIMAIGLGSLGSPERVPPAGPSPTERTGPLAAALAPGLDALAAAVEPLYRGVAENAGPVRQLTGAYLRLLGIGQNWRMFVDPVEVHQYLRARYFVGPRGADSGVATWTATELLLPVHREDEIRAVRSYWGHFRDKALTASLQRFRRSFGDRTVDTGVRSEELPDDLAPIARFFSRRFERQALRPDERIVRTEIWYGSAPIAVGTGEDPASSERMTVLREYYQGPVEDHYGRPAFAPYGSGEQEGDILWVVRYFEP